MQWIDFSAKTSAAVIVAITLDPISNDLVELGLRFGRRHVRTQSRDQTVTARASLLHFQRCEGDRFPNVDPFGELVALNTEQRNRKFKSRRHHADYGVTATVQQKRLTYECRIGIELAFPKSLADHDDIVVTLTLLFAGKGSAFDWLNSKQRK